ncbi:MAG: aquaporin family protein [Micavibrio sp.]|jgi:glycerol uptake facilitator-like aquaporin|nr:aquaporin family protein [Micavibrio sp.]
MKGFNLSRRLVAEGLGTALLVAAVVGSGIMGEQLAGGNEAIALLANTLSTGAVLIVLILIFGAISGAHFNPVVSLSFAFQRKLPWKDFLFYITAQITGGLAGTMLAHIMFDMPLLMESTHLRTGTGIWVGEIVASFGLLATILGCLRSRPQAVPYAVGLFIMSAYWFTSSTAFANPAVTIARSITDTFSGIRAEDVPCFIAAQIVGALLATSLFQRIFISDI